MRSLLLSVTTLTVALLGTAVQTGAHGLMTEGHGETMAGPSAFDPTLAIVSVGLLILVGVVIVQSQKK